MANKSPGRPVGHKPANTEKIGVRKAPRTSIKLLQEFFALMDRDLRSYDIIALRAGVTKQTLSYWRHGHRTPSAQALENVLEVLGYRLKMVAVISHPIPRPEPEELMPERIWAGDFDEHGFGHAVAGKQGGLYAEYVRADLTEKE